MNTVQPRLHPVFFAANVATFVSAMALDLAWEHVIAAPFRILLIGALIAIVGTVTFRYAAHAHERDPERYALPQRTTLFTLLWISLVVFALLMRFVLSNWERS